MDTNEQKQLVGAFVQAGQRVARSRIAIELQEMASSAIDLQHAGVITGAQRRALVEATLLTMAKLQEVTGAMTQIAIALGVEEWPDTLPGGD